MKLLDNIMYYVSVPKCVNCTDRLSRSERALCSKCKAEYDNLTKRSCSICAKPLYECSCPNEYLDSHYVHKLIKVYRYKKEDEVKDTRPPTNTLIYSLKRDNREDVLDFLAEELAGAIAISVPSPERFIFTSVPRRRAAVVKYGIDHAQLLAKATARKLGAKYKKLTISLAKSEQKKSANDNDRIKNARFDLKNKRLDLSGKSVILIDDIVTTGASMGTVSMLLKSAGALKIIGATLAVAYKDTKIFWDTSDRFSKRR